MAHKPKKILVFAKPAIGDILLATPLLRSIRASEPEATIDVMCYPGQEGILEGNADIDNVLVINQKPTLRELFDTLRRLFWKYDIAITNAADDRVHLYLLAFGKTRVSVTLKGGPAWKRWIVAGSVEDDPEHMHALVRNNHLGNILGYQSRYDIQVPREDGTRSSSSGLKAEFAMAGPYAVIHADARLPYKRWTRMGWVDVMRNLATHNLKIYLTGGSSGPEQEYIADLMKHAPDSVQSVAGKLRFAEVAELLLNCRIYLGVDTMISHMAAAVGVPTVALFGPENPVRWGPWPRGYTSDRSPWRCFGSNQVGNVLIIQSKEPCPDCTPGACIRRRSTDCQRMGAISSAQVIDGIRQMLEVSDRSWTGTSIPAERHAST